MRRHVLPNLSVLLLKLRHQPRKRMQLGLLFFGFEYFSWAVSSAFALFGMRRKEIKRKSENISTPVHGRTFFYS